MIKKYSANYTYSNSNFVLQNIPEQRIDNEYLPAICIVKNILQRGCPTLLSSFLQEELGALHKSETFAQVRPLISREQPRWTQTIRGDDENDYYPAQQFLEELVPKYFAEYAFVEQLLLPEVPIDVITGEYVSTFVNQQVDFYLPQAYLVIEIDGGQHDLTKEEDELRDMHLLKYRIETVRIRTEDLIEENEVFLEKVEAIKARIDKISEVQTKYKKVRPTIFSLEDYKAAYENGIDYTDPHYKATAIMRFQLLVLELLEHDVLHFGEDWKFEIYTEDSKGTEALAIEDLLIWFSHLLQLQHIPYQKPKVEIVYVERIEDFSSEGSIKVNASLAKRYTDENQKYEDVYYIRTDYFDDYVVFKKGNSVNTLHFKAFEPYDYFQISTTKTVKYKLVLDKGSKDEASLLFLLWNIFLQTHEGLDMNSLSFRQGQLPIIANALSGKDTIGLLPTGSGKSVCYQLAAILQPAISFVVCPIKSLMYDQKIDLDQAFFSRTNHITGDNDGEEKSKIQNAFLNGKYFFIFISPERFQIKTFREYLRRVNEKYSIAYAVIDEVHCLSEWGHDFRTSYLNLSNTINNYVSNFNWIGLTATASINVLKNIQIEFNIAQEDIKTPVDYTRKELDFIISSNKPESSERSKQSDSKYKLLIKKLEGLIASEDAFDTKSSQLKCGIIFTSTVNGKNGCYQLSKSIEYELKKSKIPVKFYAGSIPRITKYRKGGKKKEPLYTEEEFSEYRKEVQKNFKENKFMLLTATKAFGMGVNKGNIYYTFHYGIPSSMEALYQEAGRAGRDKTLFQNRKAKCFVLFEESKNSEVLEKIWDRDTPLSEIKKVQEHLNGDINTNMFLFTSGLDIVSVEFQIIKRILSLAQPGTQKVIRGKDVNDGSVKDEEGQKVKVSKGKIERAIYRLSQLGIVTDWTISNFFGSGVFNVDFAAYTAESVRNTLISLIRQYDKEFSLELVQTEDRYKLYKKILGAPKKYSDLDKSLLLLIQWTHDSFIYNRRQSLKNIYENCSDLVNGKIKQAQFKLRLENYFKFTEKSYLLQHIAENPTDYNRWFEVFYKVKDKVLTNELISKKEINSLRDNLSRFLESYMQNTGLDFISGLVRLLLNDYANADGQKRLESTLTQVKEYAPEDKDFILDNLLLLGAKLQEENKAELAMSILTVFGEDIALQNRLNTELKDAYTTRLLLEVQRKRLQKINIKLYDTLRQIR